MLRLTLIIVGNSVHLEVFNNLENSWYILVKKPSRLFNELVERAKR